MKSNMKRKFLLLAILGILVFVYCIQIAFTGKNKVRTVSIKDDPDSFEIQTGSAEVVKIYKDGDAWFVGDEKFAASTSVVDEVDLDSVLHLKLIEVIEELGNKLTKGRLKNVETEKVRLSYYKLYLDSIKTYLDFKKNRVGNYKVDVNKLEPILNKFNKK